MREQPRTKGRMTVRPDFEAEFAAVAESEGCELLEIELSGNSLKVVLDRMDGITLADCERVSRQLSALLDVADFGQRRYILEVSSPGLDRKLYGPRDYERFRGRLVRVTHLTGPERRKETVVGRLEAFNPDTGGRLTVVDEANKLHREIPLSDVKLARLEIEL